MLGEVFNDFFYLNYFPIANQYGQLGIGNVIRVNQPFNVSCFTEYNIAIIDISCGKKHTLALSDQGVIFSWGSNEFGQLGLEVLGTTQQQRKEKYKGSQQINSPSELSGLFQRSKTNGDVYMSNKTNVEGNPHFPNIGKFFSGVWTLIYLKKKLQLSSKLRLQGKQEL